MASNYRHIGFTIHTFFKAGVKNFFDQHHFLTKGSPKNPNKNKQGKSCKFGQSTGPPSKVELGLLYFNLFIVGNYHIYMLQLQMVITEVVTIMNLSLHKQFCQA
jgi:hypothetical protein